MLKTTLTPSLIKIAIFLSPIIILFALWFVIVLPLGISAETRKNIFENTITTLSFPGLVACMVIPICTTHRTGYSLIEINSSLLYLSHFMIGVIWYFLAATIGQTIQDKQNHSKDH